MKIAICEDDKIQRELILQYIEPFIKNNPIIKLSEFTCGEELIDKYKNNGSFDIIYLDIQMNDIDGIETAKKIREKDTDAIIIFITGYNKYIKDSFRLNAFQFLIKPVSQEDFNIDFTRAIEKYNKDHTNYKIKYKNEIFSLIIKEIIYIESFGHKLIAHTLNDEYEFIGNMAAEEKKLKDYNFFRIHKSFLVNLNYIKKISQNTVILKDESQIPVSKHQLANLKEKYCYFMSGRTI